jgi:hypothetical protein
VRLVQQLVKTPVADRVPAGDEPDKPLSHLAALVQDGVDGVGDHVDGATQFGVVALVKNLRKWVLDDADEIRQQASLGPVVGK